MLFRSDLEKFVNETTYEYVRSGIASIMGAQDDYLEVFIDDMQYSESAISAHISEDLTDIYQDIKDFISIFALGYEATMNDALALVSSNFKEYWGQKTVNVLRPLHSIYFGDNNEDFDSSENYENETTSENRFFENQRNNYSDEDDLNIWNE